MSLAQIVMQRIEALGKISEEPDRLTRTFCSQAMRAANDLVAKWMRHAGMMVREDAIGNLIGHYPAKNPDAKTFDPQMTYIAAMFFIGSVCSKRPLGEDGF